METSLLAQAVADRILAALPNSAALEGAFVAEQIAAPPNPQMGDLAFACFRLAKPLRQAPPKIAASLAESVQRAVDEGDPLIESAEAAGPYVNLRLRLGAAAALVLPPLLDDSGGPLASRSERVMVEFSQPNTHKAFHVGHMRNLALGDAIVRLLRAAGYEVIAANYLGDVGAHIAKCLWWYLDKLDDEERRPPEVARGEWLGDLYSKASNQLDEWADAARAGDTDAQRQLDAAKARTTDILLALEAREPTMTEVWRRTRAWSLEDFDEIYRWCKVHFDRVFYESEVDEPGLKLVEEFLERGVFVHSEGAVGIYNEEVKHMPFLMLRKRDGTSLYATKDLALAKLKFEEHKIDRSIYVVDTRQSDHFRHVFLTLEKMGFEQAKRCEHVPYEMVELPTGAMATRKGNVILFRALRERMLEHLKTHYLDKYRGEWSDEEIERTAHVLALGAIKYGMLNRDVNQKIVFDLEAWLNVEGNTGPYLQYTAARSGSIVRKGAEQGKSFDRSALADPERLRSISSSLHRPEARELILALDGLRCGAHQAADTLRPSVFCTYLHSLAKAINRFANSKECRVIQSEGDLLQARLLLVEAAHRALVWGLAQLGIETPERM